MPTVYSYDDPSIGYDEPCFFYNGGIDPTCTHRGYDDPRIGYDEQCFFYNGGYDPACGSYDSSIGYDEHCFFYNGQGYDENCLLNPIVPEIISPRLMGGSVPSRRREVIKDSLPWLNITIEAILREINSFETYMTDDIISFSGEETQMSVSLYGAQFETRFPNVRTELVKTILNESVPSVQLIEVQTLKEKVTVDHVSTQKDKFKVIVEDANKEDSSIEVSAILIKTGNNNDE